jgi:hypothetical protein
MQEITNKVESGSNFIANNEGKAQGLIMIFQEKLTLENSLNYFG